VIHLGMDTASSRGSVALVRSGDVLAAAPLLDRGAHARDLLERVDALLAGVGARTGDLSGIGVAAGPGSFTGIRIGMATAKGLAYALGVGLAGISTLEAIALAAARAGCDGAPGLVAVLEAGRGQWYAAVFGLETGAPVRETPDRAWVPGDLLEAAPERYVLAGPGVRSLIGEDREGGPDRRRAQADLPPLAVEIARWASAALPPGAGYHAVGLGPNYVRPPGAEAKRRGR
jgi:tRNA threonylcarbamoyladenosine biosynthesis protein TsaB